MLLSPLTPKTVLSFSFFSNCLLTLNWQIKTPKEGKFAHSSEAKLFELCDFNISGKVVGLSCYLFCCGEMHVVQNI